MSNYAREENREENREYNNTIQNYNTMKETFKIIIQNNVQIIILLGSGSNGKSYLINECRNYITENNYEILQDHMTPGQRCPGDFRNLLQTSEKIIMCYNFNPFTYYNPPIEKPNNTIVLDMNHIRF